jgi:RHS repeat-associated protein
LNLTTYLEPRIDLINALLCYSEKISATLRDGTTVAGNAAYVAGGSGSTARWAYSNVHGDVLTVTDRTGARASAVTLYEPYGTPLPTGPAGSSASAVLPDTNTGNGDYGWLGASGKQRLTEHSGTINTIEMGARQYSPTLGRFLQVDPVEGANDYDYVNAEPSTGPERSWLVPIRHKLSGDNDAGNRMLGATALNAGLALVGGREAKLGYKLSQKAISYMAKNIIGTGGGVVLCGLPWTGCSAGFGQ